MMRSDATSALERLDHEPVRAVLVDDNEEVLVLKVENPSVRFLAKGIDQLDASSRSLTSCTTRS